MVQKTITEPITMSHFLLNFITDPISSLFFQPKLKCCGDAFASVKILIGPGACFLERHYASDSKFATIFFDMSLLNMTII
jgi:hypothetical protein